MLEHALGPFHHVGVAVKDLKAAVAQFQAAFGAVPESEVIHDEIQQVRLQFIKIGGLRIELLEPAADSSPLDALIKRGIAIYQTCHEVDDLDATLDHLKACGAKVLSPPKPAIAFGHRRVAFVICQGLVVELLEAEHP